MKAARLFATAFACLMAIGEAIASVGLPAPLVHIKTYASSSGLFHLEVDPTMRTGAGPGNYKLTKEGRVLWEAQLPFTFHRAVVADDGTVAGYAYPAGQDGYHPKIPDTITVAIFGPDGKRRLEKKFPRQFGNYPGARKYPLVSGIFFHEDRFTVRFYGYGETWHSFRLSDGKELREVETERPKHPDDVRIQLFRAAQVPGTPLALMWWYSSKDEDEAGAIFTLVAPDGKQVWQLDAPADYRRSGESIGWERIDAAYRNGAILETAEAGHFELWFARSEQRVLHFVERKGDRWKVAEVERRPYIPPPPPEIASVPAATPKPKRLGTFTLDAPPQPDPVRYISTFDIDGRGRIGFVRGRGHFVLIDQKGTLVAELPLKLPDDLEADAKIKLTWIQADRWLVTASGWGFDPSEKAQAWWIDADRKAVTEIDEFECPSVLALDGDGKGGFVVIAGESKESGPFAISTRSIVLAFDAEGKKRWMLDHYSRPEGSQFPENVTVTSSGEIAVLDDIRNMAHVYAADPGALRRPDRKPTAPAPDPADPFSSLPQGPERIPVPLKHLRTVELEKIWKRERNGCRKITADSEGGFIVWGMHDGLPFTWIKADGSLRAEFAPKFKNGDCPDRHGDLRVAPDGRRWLSNRHHFVRLDSDAVVDAVAGTEPEWEALGIISAAKCDSKGRISATDDQTGAVHVFGSDGSKLRVLGPAKVATKIPEIGSEWKYEGSRTGLADGGFLIEGLDHVELTDAKGKVRRTVDRFSDRRWIDTVFGSAIAPDGSIVILGGQLHEDEERRLGFYSPAGDPLGVVNLSFKWETLAGWNGSHFVVTHEGASIICDREGKPVRLLRVLAEEGRWEQFVARDGRELCVLEFESRKVTRYAMPSAK